MLLCRLWLFLLSSSTHVSVAPGDMWRRRDEAWQDCVEILNHSLKLPMSLLDTTNHPLVDTFMASSHFVFRASTCWGIHPSLRLWQPTSPDPRWIQTPLYLLITQGWPTSQSLLDTWGRDRNTYCSLEKAIDYLESDLCGIPYNQMETFPSDVSAVPSLSWIYYSRPHKLTHLHMRSASLRLLDGWPLCLWVKKSEQLEQSHWLIMDKMSRSRKEGWTSLIYHHFGMCVENNGGNLCVCVYVTKEETDVA